MNRFTKWSAAVVQVGCGRGFVTEVAGERLVVTAAHCVSELPQEYANVRWEKRTYRKLLGRLNARPTVWAQCLFADLVADIAVLGSPDGQHLSEQAEAYDKLVNSAATLRIAALPFAPMKVLGSGRKMHDPGPPEAEATGYLLTLNGSWARCELYSRGRLIWISDAKRPLQGGMSGSPIISADGGTIGVFCFADGDDLHPAYDGGGPLLEDVLPAWIMRDSR